jgi:4-methyl-5(b-hydroxyethyl)-thiazole monophosphate biosynthesis
LFGRLANHDPQPEGESTMARACVILAEGFEELEAVTIVDVLRRAQVDARMASLGARTVTGSHGITLTADCSLAEAAAEPWELVVLPGGMPGAARLRDSSEVQALLRAQDARGGRIAAICAAPIALAAAGLLAERRATSYPAFAAELGCRSYVEEPVVVDGRVVTSRGPSTALAFALVLVRELCGAAKAEAVAKAMLTTVQETP